MKVSFTTLQSLFLLSFSFANKREEVFTKTTLFCDQHSAPLTWWKGMFGRTVALSSDNTALVHHAVFVTLARTGRWFDHRLSFRITPLKNSSDLTQAHAVDTHTRHTHTHTHTHTHRPHVSRGRCAFSNREQWKHCGRSSNGRLHPP